MTLEIDVEKLQDDLVSIDYKLADESYVLTPGTFQMVEKRTQRTSEKLREAKVLVRKVFRSKIGANVFTVDYRLARNGVELGITSGVTGKKYNNGELEPGIKPIENKLVLEALRTLPEEIQKWFPELNQ